MSEFPTGKTGPDTTAYIVGSGKSMDYIDEELFADKYVIGVNKTFYKFGKWMDALVVHHVGQFVQDAINRPDLDVFVAEHEMGYYNKQKPVYDGDYYLYKHPDQRSWQKYDPVNETDMDTLMVGGTTVINAIGLAYWMGFSSVVLCGCDGKAINNCTNYDGYHDYSDPSITKDQTHHIHASRKMLNDLAYKMRGHIEIYFLCPYQ